MAQLYDYQGRPVSVASLKKEEARASTQNVRSPWHEGIGSGMTPARVIAFLQAADNGDHETYVKFAADMERRDAHYYSVLQTRKLAIAQLGRKVEAPTDDATDVQIAELLDSVVNGEGFTAVLLNILDALGKGFSISEIIWSDYNEGRLFLPSAIKWRNPKFFKPHPDHGEQWLLRGEPGYPDGKPLSPFKYIIHEPTLMSGLPVAGGLARVCTAMHMFKSFGVRSWMAFAEVFGMPLRIGKYPDGKSPEEVNTLRQAIRDIGSDAAAVLPMGMELTIERAAQSGMPGGDEFFKTLSDFMNAEMSKAVLGQTMTVEDGSSLAQATIHNEVRKDLRDADAEALQDTINRYLLRPIVDLNFGPRPRPQDYPRLVLDTEEPEDLVALAQSLPPFIQLGLQVEQSVIRDKFQLPEPEEGAELLAPIVPPSPDGKDKEDPKDSKDKSAANADGWAKVTEIVRLAEGHTNHRDFMKDLAGVLKNA